jgi:transcriptional regulator with PAS, ATPase and Fis domain
MREDFFYRIHVIAIISPPLRARKEDIPLLVDHFLELHGSGDERPDFPGSFLEILYSHDWPGNVRELQNVIERYLTVERLDFSEAPKATSSKMHNLSRINPAKEGLWLRSAMQAFEKDFIMRALDQNGWRRGKTAAALGIPTRTLHRRMTKLRLL